MDLAAPEMVLAAVPAVLALTIPFYVPATLELSPAVLMPALKDPDPTMLIIGLTVLIIGLAVLILKPTIAVPTLVVLTLTLTIPELLPILQALVPSSPMLFTIALAPLLFLIWAAMLGSLPSLLSSSSSKSMTWGKGDGGCPERR